MTDKSSSPSATLSADPCEEVIEAMADCLLKTHNRVTREEVIAAWRVARASIVSETAPTAEGFWNDKLPGGISAPSATPCSDDTARLNWMERQGGAIDSLGYGDYRYYFGSHWNDLRSTIDEAMKKEAK